MTSRTIKRYSESFKIQVVREYEAGSSIPELRKKYGIAGTTTIVRWIDKYGTEGLRHRLMRIQTAEEVNRVKELEAKVEELKEALVKVSLEKLALVQHSLEQRLRHSMAQKLQNNRYRLESLSRALEAVSPLATLSRGYAIVRTHPQGRIVRDAKQLKSGQQLATQLQKGRVISTVTDTETD